MTTPFDQLRRQIFLGQTYYQQQLEQFVDVLDGPDGLEANLRSKESQPGLHASLARGVGNERFNKLQLRYTAGEDIEPLRCELEQVVAAYERYGRMLWENTQDRNEPVLQFSDLDEYCELLQLIGLCFLLHRRDLLPRIAALQDGEAGYNGGADTLYEEFMAFGIGPETRYESDWLCHKKPYESLYHGLTETTPAKQLNELNLFLKRWYKDLAGTAWHDSHKPDEAGNQGGYFGYWSFEAGAAVILLGIEDDSSLHKYLYYPKDLVAWSRQHAALAGSGGDKSTALRLRAMAAEPCPRTGFWLPPAQLGSRRHFQAGDVMPSLGGDYGVTVWQWDDNQQP